MDAAATNMEELATATSTVDAAPALDVELPPAEDIEALGDLGADGGPLDQASEKAGTFTSALGEMVAAVGLFQIAGFGADFVMGKLEERQEKLKRIDAFDDAQVTAFAEAIRQAGDDVANLVEVLESTQRITGIEPLSGEVIDITDDLAAAGVSADEYFNALERGAIRSGTFIEALEEQGVNEESLNRIRLASIDIQNNYDEAQRNAASSNQVFTESQESANEALQALLDDQDPMRRFTDEWDLLKESMSDGSIDTTAAANALNTLSEGLNLTTDEVLALAQADLDEVAEGALEFAQAWNSIDFKAAELEGATTAFSAFTDELFSAANEAERREAAFDALAASAEDQALTFNLATEAGRAQSDALEGVARVIDEDLARAYDEANGSQADFIAAATRIGDETLGRLQNELNLTDEQVNTLRNALGLTATDYEARFELAGAAEAQIQLGLLQGAIEGLPDDVEVAVNQQILTGDFVGARNTIATYYAENPVSLSTEADTSGYEDDVAGVVDDPPTATIPAEADTIQAAADLLSAASEPRTALIVAVANNQAASAALESLVNLDRTAIVDVATGVIDLPSNVELASRIGTIRIPVRAYWDGRIEGSRPR